MKKIAVGFVSAILLVLSFQPVHAEDQRVLAIIDSAVDSNKIPSVIYEACFTDSLAMACPNKQKFMEGKGSANSPFWPTSMLNTIYHGYNVTQAALATSPDIKIVFVRVSDITSSGNGSNQPASVISAIKWVSDNAAKYSIDAVSISLSSITASNIALCTTNATLVNSVSSLNKQNVPVFAATGNDKSLDKVGFPACTSGVIGVGAFIPSQNMLELATNRGPGLDVVAQNSIDVVRYNGTVVSFSATSAATPIAASLYVKQTTYTNVDLFINSFAKVLGKYPNIFK
jgi:hypothetical protein